MHELLLHSIFYIFSGLAIGSALMVITQNNPVRCVLFLVLTFLATAVLWLLAEAEFLALILILVYVGAVMTLFLFVVMMLNIDTESMKSHFMRNLPFGLIIVAFLTGLLMVAVPKGSFKGQVEQAHSRLIPINSEQVMDTADEIEHYSDQEISNTEQLGLVLYTDYLLPFEMAAVILLVAIVAAITLAHRKVSRSKRQDIVKQLMTRRDDRIQLVKMKAEKKS
jgi:NADH-quinone oxidoreductase subunit J